MRVFKSILPQFILFLAVCLLVLFVFSTKKSQTVNNSSYYQKPQIIIDAGHGGFDGGAVANDGTVEKDINLLISHKVKVLLEIQGFDVIMTRYDDSATDNTEDSNIKNRKTSDLRNRLKLMNSSPDATYVSIHLNKFNQSAANGLQVFYSPNDQYSKLLAQSIQCVTANLLQPNNNRVVKQGTKSTYLLYNAKIPAVIVECGFLSNPNELKLLKEDTYQSKIAFCIFCGILNYFNKIEDNAYVFQN